MMVRNIYNKEASRISLNDDGLIFIWMKLGHLLLLIRGTGMTTLLFSIYNGGVVPNATLKTELRFETDNDGDSASVSDLNGGLALSQ